MQTRIDQTDLTLSAKYLQARFSGRQRVGRLTSGQVGVELFLQGRLISAKLREQPASDRRHKIG
jgi:hypothetical protein